MRLPRPFLLSVIKLHLVQRVVVVYEHLSIKYIVAVLNIRNTNGSKPCKVSLIVSSGDDVNNINEYSYLRHEFEQAKKRKKPIIVIYNSLRKESNWLPSYMKDHESNAQPFWTKNNLDEKVGNYAYIKWVLGYDD